MSFFIFLTMITLAITLFVIASLMQKWGIPRQVDRLDIRWKNEQRVVLSAPEIARYYGSKPLRSYRYQSGIIGIMGIADRRLIFVPLPKGREMTLPFEAIRWVGVDDLELAHNRTWKSASVLIVHYEVDGEWYMGVWVLDAPKTVAGVLCRQLNLPLGGRDDYGPAPATCVLQDIYGEWHPAPRYQPGVIPSSFTTRAEGSLYLAPDRLVFDDRPLFLLSQLRRIAVLERGGILHQLNPLAQDLLRLEYEIPGDPKPQVVGFLLQPADQWASVLEWRTQIPVEFHAGRKKKG